MRIGIDGRLINETGVGRYIRNLIGELARIDKVNSYVVFVLDNSWKPPNERWEKRIFAVPWHSIAEQLLMPWIFLKARLDLVHIPYFNIPICYPGKMVVTIHDLTILHFDTGKATTLPYIFYKLRRLGYRIVMEVGLRRVSKIIAVSQATKQELVDHFHLNPEKIIVTYESVDKRLKTQDLRLKVHERLIKHPYLLYVGNAYPHKNLETLVRAMIPIKNVKLVLVGKEDYFYARLEKFVEQQRVKDSVVFFGQANDEQLVNLYAHAKALVFPSLMEGFGLPGLEALALGCPVIASDIPVFHEILGDNATYFHPNDVDDLAGKLLSVRRTNKRIMLNKFSWSRLASETLAIYESCARV